MTLKETLGKLETILLGNRFTAASYTALACAAIDIPFGIINNDLGTYLTGFCLGTAGLVGFLRTGGGALTKVYYDRTKKSIEEHGTLDERFAQTLIENSKQSTWNGYCEQQGLYLAARDNGHKKEVKKYLKKYSKVGMPFI